MQHAWEGGEEYIWLFGVKPERSRLVGRPDNIKMDVKEIVW
jgi:hypothetical protein